MFSDKLRFFGCLSENAFILGKLNYDSKEKLFERTDKYESRKLNQEFDDKNVRPSVLWTLRLNQKDCSEKPHKGTEAPRRDETAL